MPVAVFKPSHDSVPQEVDALFREHAPLVYRAAFSVTARSEDAEDVVQTLFLRLWHRGLPPEFGKNPKGYLYRSAINLALNSVRARRRQPVSLDPVQLLDAADTRYERG